MMIFKPKRHEENCGNCLFGHETESIMIVNCSIKEIRRSIGDPRCLEWHCKRKDHK